MNNRNVHNGKSKQEKVWYKKMVSKAGSDPTISIEEYFDNDSTTTPTQKAEFKIEKKITRKRKRPISKFFEKYFKEIVATLITTVVFGGLFVLAFDTRIDIARIDMNLDNVKSETVNLEDKLERVKDDLVLIKIDLGKYEIRINALEKKK